MKYHSVHVHRLFNGGAAGYATTHEVTSVRGLSRILPRGLGSGWGYSVRMFRPSLEALGGWETGGGQGCLVTPGGYVMVDLIPDVLDPRPAICRAPGETDAELRARVLVGLDRDQGTHR